MEAHPLLTDIEKIKCEKDVSTRIALQLNFSVWESPADGSLTPLCHRSTLKESRAGNAVAAIVCGNVRAILYPGERILRRQQKFFIRSEFFIRGLPPHRNSTPAADYQGVLRPLLNINFKRCKSCLQNFSWTSTRGKSMKWRLMQGLVGRVVNSLLSAEISACYHPFPSPHTPPSYLICPLYDLL